MLRPLIWMQNLPTRWSASRDDRGGVADEAAMLAVLLGGAVIIGGIVMMLLTKAGNRLDALGKFLPG